MSDLPTSRRKAASLLQSVTVGMVADLTQHQTSAGLNMAKTCPYSARAAASLDVSGVGLPDGMHAN